MKIRKKMKETEKEIKEEKRKRKRMEKKIEEKKRRRTSKKKKKKTKKIKREREGMVGFGRKKTKKLRWRKWQTEQRHIFKTARSTFRFGASSRELN